MILNCERCGHAVVLLFDHAPSGEGAEAQSFATKGRRCLATLEIAARSSSQTSVEERRSLARGLLPHRSGRPLLPRVSSDNPGTTSMKMLDGLHGIWSVRLHIPAARSRCFEAGDRSNISAELSAVIRNHAPREASSKSQRDNNKICPYRC